MQAALTAKTLPLKAGAAVNAGQVTYADLTDGSKLKLADADLAGGAAAVAKGIALNTAADEQPLTIITEGDLTIDASMKEGQWYVLSGTAGGICPITDLATGDYSVIIGYAKSEFVLAVKIIPTGILVDLT